MRGLLNELFGSSGTTIVLRNNLNDLSLSIISRMVLGKKYIEKSQSSFVRPNEFKWMVDEFLLLNGCLNIGDLIPWIGFLDLQGYVKRMKVLNKKFDGFLEHVLDEHSERREGEDNYVSKDMVDVLLKVAEDINLEVNLERHHIKAFIQVKLFINYFFLKKIFFLG